MIEYSSDGFNKKYPTLIAQMSEQASRNRLKRPPNKLGSILDLANLAPAQFDFPDLSANIDKVLDKTNRQMSGKKARRRDGVASDFDITALVKAVSSFVRRLPQPLRQHLSHIMTNRADWPFVMSGARAQLGGIVAVINRYDLIQDSTQKLRALLKSAAEDASGKSLRFKDETIITIDAKVFVDNEGIIRLGKDMFTEAIEGVEAKRIRECEICKHFFWAGRKDAICCSTPCHNALRNRRYRARRDQGYYQWAQLTDKKKAQLRGMVKQSTTKGL